MSENGVKPASKNTRSAADVLFVIAAVIAIIIPAILLYQYRKNPHMSQNMNLAGWGDFLAGAFGPASLLVLAAGFLLQQIELQETRKTLQDQQKELKNTAEESRRQNAILLSQVVMNEWSILRDDMRSYIISINSFMNDTSISISLSDTGTEIVKMDLANKFSKMKNSDYESFARQLVDGGYGILAINFMEYKFRMEEFLKRIDGLTDENQGGQDFSFLRQTTEYRILSGVNKILDVRSDLMKQKQ